MTKLRLSDLPPDARAKVQAQIDGATDTPKAKRRTGKSAPPTSGTDVVCHECGERCTSEPAMFRHSDATGHTRYDIPL